MATPQEQISLIGASEHNLKNIDLSIPRDSLTVFTGVSGSGKSSLAFDTIFKEGQRRFMESLSAYARQFLGQMEKPQVEHIEGLSPTISVDQKTVNRNPRSTVGTVTEVYDHYRLLFARLGEPHCPECHHLITSQTSEQIINHVYAEAFGQKCEIFAPMVRNRPGEYRKEMADWTKDGFTRIRVNGEMRRLDENIQLARYDKHHLDLSMDRLLLDSEGKSRVIEAVELSLRLSEGLVIVHYNEEDHLFSQNMACPECQVSIPELEPRLFSFNSPQGACSECKGLGELHQFAENKLCDPKKSINEGTLQCFTAKKNLMFSCVDQRHIKLLLKTFKISGSLPWEKLPEKQRHLILYGNAPDMKTGVSNVFRRPETFESALKKKKWVGIIPIMNFIYKFVKSALEKFQESSVCPTCEGKRLSPAALSVKFHGHSIDTLTACSIEENVRFFKELTLDAQEEHIGKDLFREIQERLYFLNEVGVGYLDLQRSAATLSGGEGQRIRLASQIGSGLQGVLYVLDEPSIGLHQSDNQKLIHTLELLRNRGNTVLVVEHDEETIAAADHLVDLGPTAGEHGGYLVAQGSLQDIIAEPESITGQFLAGVQQIDIPESRRSEPSGMLSIHNAHLNNLQNLDVKIPLGMFVALAGVSGSGQSSLVHGVLKDALQYHLKKRKKADETYEARFGDVKGLEDIDRFIEITQNPIGRTPRSNPATYSKAFDLIRDLFTQMPESKVRGYSKGRFSFNVKGGRCGECSGSGLKTIEMQFLSNVSIPCEVCSGKRFNTETLQIFYKEQTIHDVLEMTVDHALDFFSVIPKLQKILHTLQQVGLGYIRLGQSSTTLSGGEAQRLKLASELRKPATGKTLYILDEPTTGLHFQDIRVLLHCLQQLVNQGNSILVIEHNLDVLKVADHIIELGPGGGHYGGKIVCEGTPETLVASNSLTGGFLKEVLEPVKKVLEYSREAEPPCMHSVAEPRNENNGKMSSGGIKDCIIKGASKNNLRHIDVQIPANQITVITGVSGSGKTSLAIDTIFAEGQARYVESLSTYARRFLGRMDKAPVDSIEGLAPAIAITQNNSGRSPRSTVATSTEIYDYLRLLYARIGIAHCHKCGAVLESYTPTRAARFCESNYAEERMEILAPLYIPRSSKGLLLDHPKHLTATVGTLIQRGFTRIYVGQKMFRLEEWEDLKPKPSLTKSTVVDLVIDRLRCSQTPQLRLVEAFESAFQQGHGLLKLRFPDGPPKNFYNSSSSKGSNKKSRKKAPARLFSEQAACVECDVFQKGELSPRMFSFNSHVGACVECDGLGEIKKRKVPAVCSSCDGERLNPEARSVLIQGKNITQFCNHSIHQAQSKIEDWTLSEQQQLIAEQALKEIQSRLGFLNDVGLDYLTLNQKSETLSGGESQRIRLASQMGTGLMGVMYILDEPTLGLHPRDTARLLHTLQQLRDLGNTIILVEHDLETIQSADYLIDIGPGAGHYGGRLVAEGSPHSFMDFNSNQESLTADYLKGCKSIETPLQRRCANKNQYLTVKGAEANNLKNIDVAFPLGVLTVVTGVSGSGKSSLLIDVLQSELQNKMQDKKKTVGKHKSITGLQHIEQMVVVDQSPIGRTPRSNPATYTQVLSPIRDLFAQMTVAKQKGYSKRRFSFNVPEGRCPACEGQGFQSIEMHFLSDIWLQCEVCKGKRYNPETLSVLFRGHSIADVLNLEVDRAVELFEKQPRILRLCKGLQDVGLGYMKLGQAGNTLSGGEAQRLKLAAELSKRNTGDTLYLLDEPTTGLHIHDVARLLQVLNRLVEQGNTVIVIEHNLEVIKTADHLIDLGPEGGVKGGNLVFAGSPEDIIKCKKSHTGRALKELM